jgi:dipeptidyl aminopeptidase/acylaminoacyl peptidase
LRSIEVTKMDESLWIGTEDHFGVRSMDRPDAPEAKTWSLEAIAAVERPHHAVVSPDGSRVSFILDRDTSDVWVADITGGEVARVTVSRELAAYWEDDEATWSPDGTRLAFTSEGKVSVVAVSGGLPEEIGEGWSPVWAGDREVLYFAERDEESRLVRSGIDDGWPEPVTPPGMNVAGISVSVAHSLAVFVDYPKDDRNCSNIWLHDLAEGKSRQLTDLAGIHDRSPRISPDGASVAFTSERSGWYEVYVIGSDGEGLRQVTSAGADFSGLDWHPEGDSLLAVTSARGVDDLVVIGLDEGDTEVLGAGGEWSSPGWSSAGPLAVHEAHNQPPRLVVLDDGAWRGLLANVPAPVAAASYTHYEEVTYESFDGLEIHGFLFRPEGSGPFPAVVYPHGGPTSVYGDTWDGHAQYFLEKGYAWLAINFRGSTGYGREFERANHGVWGVADTEDCLAAADYLAALDWVDGERMGIFGASYGSYMALASLARDPQHRFACGVAKYGDSDIVTSWAQGDRGGREDIERMMGNPAENRLAYREGSPLSLVEDIARPLLIAHGERDIRVHPEQSEQLVDELKKHGKTFEYVTYPTEGHGLLRTVPQVDFYQRLERFLDWHLM